MAKDQADTGSSSSPTEQGLRPDIPEGDPRLAAAEACRNAGYETKWKKLKGGDDEEDSYVLLLAIPNGRYTRWITVRKRTADVINSVGIGPAIALGDYDAVLYKDTREIEAQLRTLGPFGPPARFRLSHLPGVVTEESDRRSDEESDAIEERYSDSWSLPFTADADQRWSASIGESSDRFWIFRSGLGRIAPGAATLRIRNVDASRHDEALGLLERVAGAILFELDLRYGISVNVTRLPFIDRTRRSGGSEKHVYRPRTPREASTDPPRLPRNSYPAKPLALYWYARSAANMPLLQYLASYQVLEYYFPTYYQREALDRMKQELLDPRFSPQNDADLMRLLSLAAPQGKSFGNEREQLKATIRACVSVRHLDDYFKDPDRRDFFSGKQIIKGVGRIDIANTSADLRDQASDRIYDIRCRIVHAKSDSGDQYPELLLPFSEEAESLVFDIELIQYLAQRILIHQAQPLHF
jgi:hypothetical protein